MSRFDGLDGAALDRHVTGNYGQDQYRDEVEEEFDDQEPEGEVEGRFIDESDRQR